MKAFHGDPEIQKLYLDRVRAHAKADEIVKGEYWEDGKGCAVGCTVHSDRHSDFERLLGIPTWLAYLEDIIFEKLPNKEAKKWPVEFLEAINLGSNLNQIRPTIMVYILDEKLKQRKFLKAEYSLLVIRNLWLEHEAEKIAHMAAMAIIDFLRTGLGSRLFCSNLAQEMLRLMRECKEGEE